MCTLSCWSFGSVGFSLKLREITTEVRPGRGRTESGKDAQVLRPITNTSPMVTCLKCWRSSGTCQGISPSRPMTPLRLWAQTMPRRVLDGNWSFDGGVVLVFDKFEIFPFVAEQIFGLPTEPQLRVRVRITRELFADLFDVVGIDVDIAAGPNEFAGVITQLVGHHHCQQRVLCDIERYTQKHVGRPLV